MMIPKLNIFKVGQYMKGLRSGDRSKISEYLEIITEDQGGDFSVMLAILGLNNLEAIRGFMTAYLLIRETMIENETKELEKLIKDDFRM